MKLVLHDGTIKDVDTSFIHNNQYTTTEGHRIYDTAVKCIIDDVRLGEFYSSSVKQGTYDEVLAAIAEERSKIKQCHGCSWFYEHTRILNECSREEIIIGNKKIIKEQTVYEISCGYKGKDGKCCHDIDEVPQLFRERIQCFFCEYPQGVPDMKPLRRFMVDNAKKYGIVPYWSDETLSIDNTFTHNKLFGSYKFEASRYHDFFELSNSRNRFKFYIDCINRKLILNDGIGYEIVDYLGTSEYDHITKKSTYEPIKNYEKFANWIWPLIDDFLMSQCKMIE